MALHELGRAGALAAFDEALRLGLAEPVLFYHRGNLLRAAGRLDEAIASYDAALRLNPAYPQALRAGALVLRDLGHRDGALKFLDEAVRLDPFFSTPTSIAAISCRALSGWRRQSPPMTARWRASRAMPARSTIAARRC